MPEYGSEIGPTGRKRDRFSVSAFSRTGDSYIRAKGHGYGHEAAYKAWGQTGVKEVKQTVHKKHPHKWVHFYVSNETRTRKRLGLKRR